jgi:hypothetical protein
MAQPLFPILKPVFPGRDTGFLLVGLKMADKKDGKKIFLNKIKFATPFIPSQQVVSPISLKIQLVQYLNHEY